MPNVMAALPNIGGCSMPQSLASRVPCINAAKTRNPLKFAGVPQTRQRISAVSRPKYLWKKYCFLTRFFPIVDTCLRSEDIARQSCAMVPKWRFFASCISSEPRAAHFRPAFQIRTRATPCVEVWQTSSLRPLRLGEEKDRCRAHQRDGPTDRQTDRPRYSVGNNRLQNRQHAQNP